MTQDYLNSILNEFSNISVNETTCLRLVSPKSTCNICQNICPVDAILIDSEINITDKCINCGLCVAKCPVGAYKINNPSDKYLIDRAAEARKIYITCKKNTRNISSEFRDSIVEVECLLRFYSEILFTLALETQGNVYLYCNKDSCKNCQQEKNIKDLISEIDKANQFISTISKDYIIQMLYSFPQEITEKYENKYRNCDESKRQLFTETINGVKKVSKASFLYYFKDNKKIIQNILKNESNESEQINNYKRRLLIDTFKKYLNKIKNDDLKLELPMNKLQVNNCYFCGVCEKLCPQSVISLTKNGKLKINYSLCTNCGLCIDICNTNSINLGEPLILEEFISGNWSELVESKEYTCQKCGATFKAGNNDNALCIRCKMMSSI